MLLYYFAFSFKATLFVSRSDSPRAEDLGEVSALHLTLSSLEEDVFLNFTEQIRSDVCSFTRVL